MKNTIPMIESTLESDLLATLDSITILPRRLVLCAPGANPSISTLRGVWGNALHAMANPVFEEIFFPEGDAGTPCYVLRGAPADPHGFPRFEHILIGRGVEWDGAAISAWMLACESGLGPDRIPFFLRGRCLGPDGQPTDSHAPWKLGQAHWPLPAPPPRSPLRISFHDPLRLLRQGKLIAQPTWPDLVVGICRRIGAYLPPEHREDWKHLSQGILDTARTTPALPWRGGDLDLVRWSGRQKTEVQLRGVSGCIDLPFGPGPLWPLLAASSWLHLGKGTVMGLGRPYLESLNGPRFPPMA